jgi:hypothetical protein
VLVDVNIEEKDLNNGVEEVKEDQYQILQRALQDRMIELTSVLRVYNLKTEDDEIEVFKVT